MEVENKDTIVPAADSSATPVDSTQVDTQSSGQVNTPPASADTGKMFAGKFKTPEDLEAGYQSLETKLGQKAFAETVGDRLLQETGYTVKDLQEAGYTPDDILGMIATSSAPPEKVADEETPPAKKTAKVSIDKEKVDSKVLNARLAKLEWDLKMDSFVRANPELEQFRKDIEDWRALPQYQNASPDEIFTAKLSKFVLKGVETTMAKQEVKERATLSVSNGTPPTVKKSDALAKNLRTNTGRLDLDAAGDFMKAVLKGE